MRRTPVPGATLTRNRRWPASSIRKSPATTAELSSTRATATLSGTNQLVMSRRSASSLSIATTRITAEVIDEIPQEVRKGFDGKRRIKINLPDDLEIGRVHATLKITSLAAFAEGENPNVQEEHISNVSVLGRVVGNLQASPSAIRMLPLKPGEEFTYSTKISHRGNREFVVTNDDITLLRSSIPGVEATIEPYEEDGESGYVFTIKGKSGNHRGAFRGTYAIKSDIEGEPPLRLNFSGTVRAR